MARSRTATARAAKSIDSTELKNVLKRVKASELSAKDKATLNEILGQSIKLKQLIEKAKVSHGGKAVVASLPFGFDLLK